MTNYMVKSGCGRICFTNLAKSGSRRISQKQIRYSPISNWSQTCKSLVESFWGL